MPTKNASGRKKAVRASASADTKKEPGPSRPVAAAAAVGKADPPAQASSNRKRISLAFQGGGAHGAFTWGVVDRLLEDGRIEVEGIVGTSAGAMNAAVTAYGLSKGGPAQARHELATFWRKISEAGQKGPLQPSWLDKMMGNGSLEFSPMWHWLDMVSRVMSPYQLNPFDLNPLRDVLLDVVDFEFMKHQNKVKLFLCATNVLTGRVKVFSHNELSVNAVLASGCLPFLFKAVEVNGEHYWDGGYMGNPPLFPLIYECESRDILIVQINPINIPEVPTEAPAIFDRINTLSFNSSLMREMRVINFVSQLVDQGDNRHKRVLIHTVDAEDVMARMTVSSKLNPDWDHLLRLYAIGRERADAFLQKHFDDLNVRSSTDIAAKFL
jgi:NTE family protein